MTEPSRDGGGVGEAVLRAMVDRLIGAMTGGPAMNCRPHSSRQRIDLTAIAALDDLAPAAVLAQLLGERGKAKLRATVEPPPPAVLQRAERKRPGSSTAAATFALHDADAPEPEPLTPEERDAVRRWDRQRKTLAKLRAMAEDARDHERDTGVASLAVGYPLLSLPPTARLGGAGVGRRVLAPIAFVPIDLALAPGGGGRVELSCRGEGAGRVVPNETLLLWLAGQCGLDAGEEIELFDDPEGTDPHREIDALVRHVAELVAAADLADFAGDPDELDEAPTAAEADEDPKARVLRSAVLGLYPASNQGLLRDAQAMLADGAGDGPVRAFVDASSRLAEAAPDAAPPLLAAAADPCQARAVSLARSSRCLVIHGPPGTGKSQTIANIVCDHLGRGARVLFVSDKRTALDVVHDRLVHLGLGDLCAIVHDPRRDRTTLYRQLRDQLERLSDLRPGTAAAAKLAKVDARLARIRSDVDRRRDALLAIDPEADPPVALQTLIGQWLDATAACGATALSDASAEALTAVPVAELVRAGDDIEAAVARGASAGWASNPWRGAIGLSLDDFIDVGGNANVRRRVEELADLSASADAAASEAIPPFDVKRPLAEQLAARAELLSATEEAEEVDPAWADTLGGDASALDRARQQMATVAPHAAALRQPAPPVELLSRTADVSPGEAGKRLDQLRGFERQAQQVAGAVAAAGPAARPVVLDWVAKSRDARDAARRVLADAAGLASAVKSADADAVLMARLHAANVPAGELTQRRLAVASYASAAAGFFGFLAFGKKKRAAPTLAAMGLPADAASAARAVPVLDALQAEADLAAQVARLGDVERGQDLLRAFETHRAALASLDADGPVPTARPDAAVLQALPGREAAAASLDALGLPLAPDGVAAAKTAYKWRVAADGLRRVRASLAIEVKELSDVELAAEHAAVSRLLESAEDLADHRELREALAAAVRGRELAHLREGLAASPARAEAVGAVEESLGRDALFTTRWRINAANRLRRGESITASLSDLAARADTAEDVVRVGRLLDRLPAAISGALRDILRESVGVATAGGLLRRSVFEGEIARRLAAAGDDVRNADGREIDELVDRLRALGEERAGLVRDAALDLWHGRQRERLLSATGSRLNSDAADLRRRLAIRGKKVMRLRQLVAAGASTEGGDPLFDLRPVWMASPETVAQVFPREPLFDVVVFDEASQVRLEEALPVMTRGGRVVIAGDPKQLPPTRFFESAVAASAADDPETDDELFEAQQSETEDLLTAALALDVDEAFLDVHYRSRNADLIGFSNEHFYGGRLQPIPGHPANVTPYAPLRLYRANGVYADRSNEAEARQVVRIVRDLLKWADPPSVGIACFNLPQRDLILEALDAAATEDADFARRLAAARERSGPGGFEGLFVKNLESVQGDERDHIVISTTYGPNEQGKFRRNFGPVSQGGGGRRLNVLVTRARHEVHLVTSIPDAEFASLPPVPAGQQPTGRWLLYAYLHYADALDAVYKAAADESDAADIVSGPSTAPSPFVDALARAAAGGARSVHSYWGGDGLGLDLVVGQHDPAAGSSQVDGAAVHATPVGMVADLARHVPAGDAAEWEAFRRDVHLSQGWRLARLWSPQVFRQVRDDAGALATALNAP